MQAGRGDDPPIYEFGWWPEIVGCLMVIGLITFLITMAEGIM